MSRILVIDDDDFFRKSLVEYLELEGFEVDSHSHLLDLELVTDRGVPAAILCDVMLPGCSGIDILKQIRLHGSTANVPFLFISAKADTATQRQAMNLGADDYITKPVSADNLMGALRTRLTRLAGKRTSSEPVSFERLREKTPEDRRADELFDRCTPRERDIIRALITGLSNSAIAEKLGIADSTVKRHLLQVFMKLEVESRCMAVSTVMHNPRLVWLLSREATPTTK
jgi:DNA-binding NarL/FixJ family response regulator